MEKMRMAILKFRLKSNRVEPLRNSTVNNDENDGAKYDEKENQNGKDSNALKKR